MKLRNEFPNATDWTTKIRSGENTTRNGVDISKFIFTSISSIITFVEKLPPALYEKLMDVKTAEEVVTKGITYERWQKFNKYAVKQTERLDRWASIGLSEGEKFEKLSKIISTKSKVFKIHMLRNGVKDWNKLSDMQKLRTYAKAEKLIRMGKMEFNYKRILIPKPNSVELRPLAVADKGTRVVAKWYLELFKIWIDPSKEEAFNDYQFGGIAKRNTAQAWDRIWKSIKEKKFIFEFDLAKCFDSIDHSAVECFLIGGFPRFLINYILGCVYSNTDQINLQQRQKEKEIVTLANKTIPSEITRDLIPWTSKLANWIKSSKSDDVYEHIHKSEQKAYKKWMEQYGSWEQREQQKQRRKQWNLWEKPDIHEENRPNDKGIPQGWAFSPMIANILLAHQLPQNTSNVLYLDDGLIAANDKDSLRINQTIARLKSQGLTMKAVGSGLVRENGRWIKPLKFLGIKLQDGKDWSNETRSGKSKAEWTFPTFKEVQKYASGKTTVEYWAKPILQSISNLPVTELQTAYLYNDGKTYNPDGTISNWDLRLAWVKTFRYKAMKKWCRESPQNARNLAQAIVEAINRGETLKLSQKEKEELEYIQLFASGRTPGYIG